MRIALKELGFLAASIVVLLTGCSETTGGSVSSGAGGALGTPLPCAVDDVLALRCRACHSAEPKFGAPIPLTSRDDLLALSLDGATTVADVVVQRMADTDAIMPPPPNPPATEAEVAAIADWIADGHPPRPDGEMCQGAGGHGGAGGSDLDCTPDLQIRAMQPFTMTPGATDEQVCFGVEVPATGTKRHITVIAPKVDNSTIIHHILLLSAATPVSPEPAGCSLASADWKLLYAWGPGTPPHKLPPEAGFPIEANEDMHLVLQIHYSNLSMLEDQSDHSGLDLCTTTDLRKHDADVMAFGGIGFSGIAPNAISSLSCSMEVPALLAPYLPLKVFQSWPHMHRLGHRLSTVAEHPGGEKTTMADVKNYSFDYQITYPNDVELEAGAQVTTTCAWKNDTPQSVSFGEKTEDEMCFNFVSYYPRIDAEQWHWLLPAGSANCDPIVVE